MEQRPTREPGSGFIQRLNLSDLDVTELEQRLELATAASPEGYTCGTDCTAYGDCHVFDTVQPAGW